MKLLRKRRFGKGSFITTTLFLVRHGETDANRRRIYMGRDDEPLNERGRLQAQAVAGRLSSQPISLIFSSTISRAVQTAEAIAARVQAPIEKTDRFMEIDFGPWQGLSAEEIQRRWPRAWRLWKETPHLLDFSGVETLTGVRIRVEEGLDEILEKWAGKSVAIVSHDVVIRTLCAIILEIDNSRYRSFSAANASLSVIHFENGRGLIDLLNDTSHLVGLSTD